MTPPRRPAYAFDTEGHTVVTPAREDPAIAQLKLLGGITLFTFVPSFIMVVMICMRSSLFDALGYMSAILLLSIAAGITLQRIEDKHKEQS